MIKYKIDILAALKNAGISQYIMRRDKLFAQSEITDMRRRKVGSIRLLSLVCKLLCCQPGDIAEYIPDDDQE